MEKRKVFWPVVFWVVFAFAFYMAFFVYFLDNKSTASLWIGTISGFLALLFAALKAKEVFHQKKNDNLANIAEEHSKKQPKCRCLATLIFVLIIGILLAIFIDTPSEIHKASLAMPFLKKILYAFPVTFCFYAGILCSAAASFFGMMISKKTIDQTNATSEASLTEAFKTAFSGASAIGMCIAGVALIGITILYSVYKDYEIIGGFALGASIVALFAHTFLKKIGTELFESYICSIVAAIVLGALCLNVMGGLLPIVIAGIGIFASIIALHFVRIKENANLKISICIAVLTAISLFLAGGFYVIHNWLGQFSNYLGIFLTLAIGTTTGLIIGFSTNYFSSKEHRPTKNMINTLQSNTATGIARTFKITLYSTFVPFATLSIAILTSFLIVGGMENYTLGMFGIALAGVSMLSTAGIMLSLNSYSSMTNKVNKFAQITKTDSSIKEINKITVKAICRNFATSAMAIVTLSLLVCFATILGLENIDILNPFVMSGIVFGACLPFFFSAVTINSSACCKTASPKTFLTGIIAIGAPLIVGLVTAAATSDKILGAQTLGGMLTGAIITGTCLAIIMANAEASINCIEKSNKSTDGVDSLVENTEISLPIEHLNTAIKLMVIVSLVCVSLFIK